MRSKLRRAFSTREKLLTMALSSEENANQVLLLNDSIGTFNPKEVAQLEKYWGEQRAASRNTNPWWLVLLFDAAGYSPELSAFPEGRQMLKEMTVVMKSLKKEIQEVYEEHGFDVVVESLSFDHGNDFIKGISQYEVVPKDEIDSSWYVSHWTAFDIYDGKKAMWAAGFLEGGKRQVLTSKGPGLGKDFKSTLSKQVRFLRGGIAQLDTWLDKHPKAQLSSAF